MLSGAEEQNEQINSDELNEDEGIVNSGDYEDDVAGENNEDDFMIQQLDVDDKLCGDGNNNKNIIGWYFFFLF